jgi:IS5 family transposase
MDGSGITEPFRPFTRLGTCWRSTISPNRSLEKSKQLKANGLAMQQGTIIDATLIATPNSTQNEKKERDLEIDQTCNGKKCYYHFAEDFANGMNVDIVVESESGFTH